jgi:MFS family permease
MNPSLRRAPESPLGQSTVGEPDAVYAKIAKRIIPFMVVLFLMAWLDRYNLGFAKLQMVKDLGFSEAVYGFGAGIVYLGYMLFEIPSNLFLERIGARKTFARITILWGITSIATMFVKTAGWFYFLRFLLGSFEAGLFPGVVLYLTYWFPARHRALMQSLFATSIPLSIIVGGPISGWIMGSMGGWAGVANWQWLFLLEGVPSILIGLLSLAIIADKPEQARWLSEQEKKLVLTDLERDRNGAGARERGFREALRLPRVWLLVTIYFCGTTSANTLGFWIPSIIHGLGVKRDIMVGLLTAVPSVVSMMGMVLISRHSDRTLERRYHTAFPLLACAIGLVAIGLFANSPIMAFAALVIAVASPSGGLGVFWTMPTMVLTGSAAAGGIALINSIGSLSGWVGPSVVGWMEDITGKTATGLYIVAGLEILGAVLILLFIPRRLVVTSGTAPK